MLNKLEKIYLDLFNSVDEYKINKDNQLEKFEEGLTKNNLDKLLNEIKDSQVDNIVIIMDSYKNLSHAHQVKAIVDTNLKEENNVKTFYIPFSSKNKEDLNRFEAIEKIIENNPNKKVFINQSFGSDLLKESFEASLDSIKPIKDSFLIKKINEDNDKLINLLNKYENLNIVKSAGNNIEKKLHRLNEYLKVVFDKITNNNYETTKEITLLLNNVLNKIVKGEEVSKDIELIESNLKPLFVANKLSYDNFISLYINDFLVHYDTYNLLDKSKDLKNNNLSIVEAFDEKKILDNYNAYKEYNQKEIPELEDYFTLYKKYKLDYSYSKEDVAKLKELYENNKDKYPEIFKISTFGTFSSLEHHNKESFKFGPHKQDSSGLMSASGTSFATPEVLSDIVKKSLELETQKIAFNNIL